MYNEYDGTQRSDRLLDTPFLNGDKNSYFLNNLRTSSSDYFTSMHGICLNQSTVASANTLPKRDIRTTDRRLGSIQRIVIRAQQVSKQEERRIERLSHGLTFD